MKKIFKVFARDLKNLTKSPVAIIIISGLCFLPSLYAWINIKACWDPYKNTGNLPIVIVNNDEGSNLDSKYINVGSEVVENLKKDKAIGWVFEDEWQANDGLNKGKYYALIEIPNNFTDGLISLTTVAPRKPEIVYKANEKANAIATKITDVAEESLVREVKTNFIDTVNKTAIELIGGLSDSLQMNQTQIMNLKDTMVQATDDLSKVSEYLTKAADKSNELQTYLGKVQSDLPKITDSISNLQNTIEGSKNLIQYTNYTIDLIASNINSDIIQIQSDNQNIINVLANIKNDLNIKDTVAALNKVNEMKTLNNSQGNLTNADINLLKAVNSYNNNDSIMTMINLLGNEKSIVDNREGEIDKLRTAINAGDSLENINKIIENIGKVNDDLSKVIIEISNLNYRTVVSVFNTITNNLDLTLDTSNKILDNTKAIVPQLQALSTFMMATNNLSIKQINELNTKIIALNSDLTKLNNETKDLTDENLQNIIDMLLKNPEEVASFISSPIELKEEEVYDSGIFGVGLTPFYSVLAIWVGALLACCLLCVECEEENIKELKLNHFQSHFGKLLLFISISLVQAFIITTGDLLILGVNAADVGILYLFTFLTSVTFTVIIFTLVSMLGNVGKAIAVIMMVFQIAGSGGIYPIQTNPAIFGLLQPLWPFTYAINGFREGISGAVQSHVQEYSIALICFTVAFLVLVLVKKPIHKLASAMDHKFREAGL